MMPINYQQKPSQFNRLSNLLDIFLNQLSIVVLPLVIAAVSLISMVFWDAHFATASPQTLGIHVLEGAPSTELSAQKLQQLQGQPTVTYYDTRRSEAPIWFSFTAPQDPANSVRIVEFPSRHTTDIACWNALTMQSMGHGRHQSTFGNLTEVKSGFALTLNAQAPKIHVVCRANSVGPARLSALQWHAEDLNLANQEFHRRSGLLDGGLLVLAVFILITALVNRNGLYFLFSAWLIINLRMGALSAGWDFQWLGNTVPPDWILRLRLVTTALYFLLTVTLFQHLFRKELTTVKALWLLKWVQWMCLPLLVLSCVLTYQSYLPYLWVSSGLTVITLVFFLSQILKQGHSRVALWYSASIAVSLLASFSELLAAALGIKSLIDSVNFVTAALSSSLLAALAIAEHMRQEHLAHLAVQAELTHTFEAMPIGLFTLDLHGRFMSANPALGSMLGAPVMEEGKNEWQHYFSAHTWADLYQLVHEKTDGELEIKGRSDLSGQAKRFLVKATLARDKIEGSLQDVTEKSKATEHLYFLANHDPLTKVLNRRGIEKAFHEAMDNLKKRQPLGLAYLDLDRFKLINDLYGHGAGDEVLQQVCKRVSTILTPEFRFGRVGGDEFVIIFPETPIALAAQLSKSIVESIGTLPYRVGEKAFYVRGSIGLIEMGANMQFNDAMSTADWACRQAKTSNGAGFVVYEHDALAFTEHAAELTLIALLATSSATDGLYLEMQPIMSLTHPHESLNFEVLLRMRDANGHVVRTDHLIKAAESSGRMGVIDRWVLSTTLAWINTHCAQLTQTKFICMNLSGASLNDEKFLQHVYATLQANLSIVGKLCLEITESVALHDLENTRQFVDKVRGFGAKVALDDFGAGYTSFSYLKEFTTDLLKIDGSFIINMNQHPANTAIVEAIVSLAKNLGMKVIAEWAEDRATVQTLTEIGVDYVQGFVVARPQAPENMLTAESAASFIQDDALAAYVASIAQRVPLVTPLLMPS